MIFNGFIEKLRRKISSFLTGMAFLLIEIIAQLPYSKWMPISLDVNSYG
jgi:hypothetical protein